MMQSMVPSTHLFFKYFPTCILYIVQVSIVAYVMDRAFNLGTYIIDKVLGMHRVHQPLELECRTNHYNALPFGTMAQKLHNRTNLSKSSRTLYILAIFSWVSICMLHNINKQ